MSKLTLTVEVDSHQEPWRSLVRSSEQIGFHEEEIIKYDYIYLTALARMAVPDDLTEWEWNLLDHLFGQRMAFDMLGSDSGQRGMPLYKGVNLWVEIEEWCDGNTPYDQIELAGALQARVKEWDALTVAGVLMALRARTHEETTG